MKYIPILFKPEMVRAILAGAKTQTRRIVKEKITAPKFKYNEGDVLWVKENYWLRPIRTEKDLILGADTWPKYIYDADEPDIEMLKEYKYKHKPSIFTPRAASRITLEIIGVEIQRLQMITESDARAEGATKDRIWGMGSVGNETYREGFRLLWDYINSARGYGWKENPLVYRIEFKIKK